MQANAGWPRAGPAYQGISKARGPEAQVPVGVRAPPLRLAAPPAGRPHPPGRTARRQGRTPSGGLLVTDENPKREQLPSKYSLTRNEITAAQLKPTRAHTARTKWTPNSRSARRGPLGLLGGLHPASPLPPGHPKARVGRKRRGAPRTAAPTAERRTPAGHELPGHPHKGGELPAPRPPEPIRSFKTPLAGMPALQGAQRSLSGDPRLSGSRQSRTRGETATETGHRVPYETEAPRSPRGNVRPRRRAQPTYSPRPGPRPRREPRSERT